jgi:hypothetical protein
MQMRLSPRLCSLNPLLQRILRLFHKQPMQIYRILRHSAIGIVCAKNEVGSLLIVRVHLARMFLALERQFMRAGTIASLIGLTRAVEARGTLCGFFTRKVAEAVVFGFGVVGRVV